MVSEYLVDSDQGNLLSEPRWYALRTRARAEKKTDILLRRAGIETFAAVVEVERRWKDRTRRVEVPLFSGYIFVHIPLEDSVRVLRQPGAVELVKSRGVPAPLREEEMDAVMRLVRGMEATGNPPVETDYLQPGMPVLVTQGPFQGMKGVLMEARGRSVVAVKLDAIRMARAVQVDRRWVKRVDRAVA
ncbi:MAG: UpxY family transcription antiterminator [Gemmatimonadota bacterium]